MEELSNLLFIKGSLCNIKHSIIKIKIWDASLFFKNIKVIIMVWCRNLYYVKNLKLLIKQIHQYYKNNKVENCWVYG